MAGNKKIRTAGSALRLLLLAACLFMLASCGAGYAVPTNFERLTANGSRKLDEGGLLSGLQHNRVIFIGEAHTQNSDHSVQLEVIKYLVKKGCRPVIAMEMFPDGDGVFLNRWEQGRISQQQFRQFYKNHWEIGYSHYANIFEYAKKHRLPLVGINAGKEFIQEVELNGLSVLRAEDLLRINFTPCSSDPAYRTMLMAGFTIHHAVFNNFCNAQRLRDYIMAWHVAELAVKYRGPVVVLLGAAHAVKRAVPLFMAMDFSKAPPYTVMVPEEINFLFGKELDHTVADYTWY
ncbi:MAG: ChaN family lipoprotein [Actinomycetota bacterium]|nr:ChaN family lipoprotein [Actinomycetota bacterium]